MLSGKKLPLPNGSRIRGGAALSITVGAENSCAPEASSEAPAETKSMHLDVTELGCWQSVYLTLAAKGMVEETPETHRY
jgi:hypothetical protein